MAKVCLAVLLFALLGLSAMMTEPLPDPGRRDRQLGLPLHAEGAFKSLGPASGLPWSGEQTDLEEFDSANSGAQVGTVRSSAFAAPVFLRFYVAGFPSAAGMRMYLRDVASGRTLDLVNSVDPGPQWQLRQWKIPRGWRRASVVLMVEDAGSGPAQWVGISEPRGGEIPIWASMAKAAHRHSILILLSLLFLLPGVAMLLGAAKLGVTLNMARAMATILGGSSLTAYAVFWIYLCGRRAGNVAAWTVLSISLIAGALLLGRGVRLRPALGAQIFRCLGTVLLVAIFYTSLGFIYDVDTPIGQFAQQRYLPHSLPPDNVLQEIFAERIYDAQTVGTPLTRPLVAYWHTSDRPPLETAITLLAMPFSKRPTRDLHYQLLGVFLQCTWIAGLWTLLHAAGIRGRYIASAIAFGVVSDFCLLHGFYIWPKLFAGAFCLLGLSFFPWTRRAARWTALDVALTGFMFGFALLTHPGAVLTVGPAIAMMYRKRPRLRLAAWGVAALLLLQLPWMAYQKFVDPPGDSLLKLHLAGNVDLQHTLGQAVRTAYSHLTARQYLWNKLANVGALFGGSWVSRALVSDWRKALDSFLTANFFYLSLTLGLMSVGLAVRLFWRRRKATRAWKVADRFAAIAAGTLLVWCFIMFEPESTIVHQGSFATVLLLFASCVLYLADFRPWLLWVLLAMQTCLLFPIFVFGRNLYVAAGSVLDDAFDPGMTMVAFGSFVLLVFLYGRSQGTGSKTVPMS